MKKTLKIVGMSCVNCANAVEKAALSVEGVQSAAVSLSDDSLTIEYKDETCVDAVAKAVAKAGYKASLGDSAVQSREEIKLKRRLIASIVLMTAVMSLALGDKFADTSLGFFGCLEAVLVIPVMIINRHFYFGAVKALASKRANMDVLVTIGSLASFACGIYESVQTICKFVGGGEFSLMNANPFFESAGMILTLVSVGKFLESRARRKTGDALAGLVALRPSMVTVKVGDTTLEKPVGELNVGDIFIIKSGDHVPADGIVAGGNALLDESSVTGESVAVDKKEGDEVTSGTTVIKGRLEVGATAVGDDCTLMQIVRMTREAGLTKAPIARLADKVASIFVPAVCAVALVTFIIWMVCTGSVNEALTHALCVLVISCPCALGLATPLSITVGMGEGAKRGILFKSAESLEKLSDADIFLFDKTGTVTGGEVSEEGEVSGDSVRDGAPEMISYLKSHNIQTVLLTGDKDDKAAAVAKAVGVDEYKSLLLPGDKYDIVKEYRKTGKNVVMTGDGVNDAPALAAADIGIAMGSGRDIAIDSADVILMHSAPADLVKTMKLSAGTILNIKENLFWALFYNMLGIPIAAGALYKPFGIELNPTISAACMCLSSLCVVMNSLRLKRIKLDDLQVKQEDKENVAMVIGVEGMMCEHCAKRVTDACMSVQGVESAVVNLKEKNVTVTASEGVSEDEVKKAILDAGYMLLN